MIGATTRGDTHIETGASETERVRTHTHTHRERREQEREGRKRGGKKERQE